MASDPLVDRSCVLLDGRCDCPRPVTDNCKYVRAKEHAERREFTCQNQETLNASSVICVGKKAN